MAHVFTESSRIVHSREECIEGAAEALARCFQRLRERPENTTTPAEARAV